VQKPLPSSPATRGVQKPLMRKMSLSSADSGHYQRSASPIAQALSKALSYPAQLESSCSASVRSDFCGGRINSLPSYHHGAHTPEQPRRPPHVVAAEFFSRQSSLHFNPQRKEEKAPQFATQLSYDMHNLSAVHPASPVSLRSVDGGGASPSYIVGCDESLANHVKLWRPFDAHT
jgi:hypothetical protein